MISTPEHSKKRIIISPHGDIDSSLINHVSNSVSRRFGYRTEIHSLLREIDFALDSARKQYYSTTILERLAGLAPSHAIKVLSICQVDLFIPILTHVYGEAQIGGKACIVSTFRLNDELPAINSQDSYRQRIAKEAIHELGHTFNLRHCRDRSCGMHYSRTLRDVDNKSEEFCRYCRILLDDELKRLSYSPSLPDNRLS